MTDAEWHAIQTAVLSSMADLSQEEVARRSGFSPCTVSRFKKHDLEPMAKILAACDLTVIPRSEQRYDREFVAVLKTLAKRAIDSEAQK